jgi:hypothetical protein
MFWKKKKQQDGKKTTHESYENLAVPEVHTEPEVEDEEGEEEQDSITYESVAIPEIHIRKKKK